MSYPVTTNFAGRAVEVAKFHSPFLAADYAGWLSRERGDTYYADADLIDSGVCWAVEWAEDGGWGTVAAAEGVTWPLIPVTVEYDEGVLVAPITPHPGPCVG